MENNTPSKARHHLSLLGGILLSPLNLFAQGDPLVFHSYPAITTPTGLSSSVRVEMTIDHAGGLHATLLDEGNLRIYHYSPDGSWSLIATSADFSGIYAAELLTAKDGQIWLTVCGTSPTEPGDRLFTKRLTGDSGSAPFVDRGPSPRYSWDVSTRAEEGILISTPSSQGATVTEVTPESTNSYFIPNPAGHDFGQTTVAQSSSNGFYFAAWSYTETLTERQRQLNYAFIASGSSDSISTEVLFSATEPVTAINYTAFCEFVEGDSVIPIITQWNPADEDYNLTLNFFGSWGTVTIEENIAQPQFQLPHFDELSRLASCYHPVNSTPRLTADNTFLGESFDPPATLTSTLSPTRFDAAVDAAGYLHFAEYDSGELFFHSPLDLTDLDGDGLPYAVELALLRDPDEATPPSEQIDFRINSNQTASMSFLTLADAAFDDSQETVLLSPSTRLRMEVQGSKELKFWDIDSEAFDSDLFSIAGRGKLFSTSQVNDVSSSESYPFMRLQVIRERNDPNPAGGL